MRVFLQSKPGQPITLTDFKGAGGEGAVFVNNGRAFKIYGDTDSTGAFTIDPSKMMNPAKIRELSVLTDPRIVKPEEVIVNASNTPIGYVMPFIDGFSPIQLYFSAATQRRLGVTGSDRIEVTKALSSIMAHCHKHKTLLVDPNENNWLVGRDNKSIRAIDVDGWQTPSFPAKAILPDIRDARTKGFDDGSDWYSLAYVLFRYWTGVGPYDCTFDKGGPAESRDPMFLRTKLHSVFDPKTSHRAFGIPEDQIPADVLSWFKGIFQLGLRLPFVPGNVVAIDANIIRKISMQLNVVSKVFNITLKNTTQHDIIGVSDYAISTNNGKGWLLDVNGTPVNVYTNSEGKIFVDTRGVVTETIFGSNNLRMHDNMVFFQTPGQIQKLVLIPGGNGKMLSTSTVVCRTTLYSTKLFEGVVFQEMIGSYVVNILTSTGSPQITIPELRSYNVIDAKKDGTVLVVLASKAGKNHTFIFRFNSTFTSYTFMSYETADTAVNFVALTSGVCMVLDEMGTMRIFFSDPNRNEVKEVHDDALQQVQLCRQGAKALFFRGKELYTLSLS